MSVRVTFLGGLGEIGRNCAALEIDGKLALIDCGLMFPEEDMLGVDLVLPDFSSVVARSDDLECVIITHGHEDHVGALAYFLQDIPVPVYGTSFSVALARSRVEELGIDADFRPIPDNEWVKHGSFRFMLVPVSHSVPHGSGIAFDTPEGLVVHSGDFKLDPTPIDGRPTDLPTFAELGRAGVRLLMADSTNAENPGFVRSETSLTRSIHDIVHQAPGRVVAACFASHVHRVQQMVDAALHDGRHVAFLGRSMHRVSRVGRELRVLDIPEERVHDIEDLVALPPHQQMVISTGSQGEPFAALSLIASGRHRHVEIRPDDTFLISATPIPGNEAAVSKVISRLLKTGPTVYHGRNAHVHVSGHGAQEELKTFLSVVRPRAFVPVHGEFRHLRAHADLAIELRVPEVFALADGDAIVLEDGEARVERQVVEAGYVYLDGSEVGDVGGTVLRDRRHLADEGVVIVTVGVKLHTAELIYGPVLDSHGLMEQPDAVLAKAGEAVRAALDAALQKGECDIADVQKAVRDTTRRVVRDEISRKPVVLPVVMEV